MGYLLAGDLGGTKALLALDVTTGQGYALLREQRFACRDYDDFFGIIAAFLRDSKEHPQLAAFGVAGPIAGGTARMTNLGWLIDRKALREQFRFAEVFLLNDLVAVAQAVSSLPPEDLRVVNAGTPVPQGSRAVLAPGTGLGEAYLCWNGMWITRPFPRKRGMSILRQPRRGNKGCFSFLRAEQDHVSYELVCSGTGIPNIYRYLTEGAGMQVASRLQEALDAAPPPFPI